MREQCLAKWLQTILGSIVGEIIPIDGKSVRGSYDRNQGVKAWHLVTAWASEQRLVLGQVKVEDHSNEITAIPALLELLDLTGAIVTIDAMGTQTEIVKQIRHKKADYIVSLKANHPTLHSQVKEWFDTRRGNNFEGINVSYNQQIEKGHHRTEKRYVWAVPLEAFGGLYQQDQWSGLRTAGLRERVTYVMSINTDKDYNHFFTYHQ